MLTTPTPPSLAGGLRTSLLARQPSLEAVGLPPELFAQTAVRCDEADRAYRTAIDGLLAPGDAREVHAAAQAFRERVREVRAAARSESDALLARAGREPVDFDPLDLTPPPITGLTHADTVRLADLCDRARQQVDGLRAQANARIAPLLSDVTREALVAAKRVRIAAFRGAVHAELAPLRPPLERFSQTVEALAGLADGWY